MKFTFVTLFPKLISGYFEHSILGIAKQNKVIDIAFDNPRNYATNKHKKVDDYMVGGGAGLAMTVQPLYDCLAMHKDKYIILSNPKCKAF